MELLFLYLVIIVVIVGTKLVTKIENFAIRCVIDGVLIQLLLVAFEIYYS